MVTATVIIKSTNNKIDCVWISIHCKNVVNFYRKRLSMMHNIKWLTAGYGLTSVICNFTLKICKMYSFWKDNLLGKTMKGHFQKSLHVTCFIIVISNIHYGVLCYICCYLVNVYCISVVCVTLMGFCLCVYDPVHRLYESVSHNAMSSD